MQTYTLNINGRPQALRAAGDTPLLWVLRDELGLTGTKYGCGQGLCGACTVHVDGQAVRSCQLPLGELGARAVTTIEGLHPQGEHPVQKAWLQHDVAQCGFCQCGQIMQAAALLKAKPRPSAAEIDAAMAGNLCRCGTQLRIRAAIQTAAGVAA
jgi:isoquinoline 1-oxidoreductase alpha subunit